MKPIRSYPLWLSACMLLGPFLMVSGAWVRTRYFVWVCQIAGAFMVMLALFYLSKRLHEHMEEVESLRQLLNRPEDGPGPD
jgi:hypothetical protein